jgi:hypothetical protein
MFELGAGRRLSLFLLICCAIVRGALAPEAMAGMELPVLSESLPAFPASCELTGESVRPDTALRGKPALLFFTTPSLGMTGELAGFVADLQAQYAPWVTWVGVIVGPVKPSEVRSLHEASPVRFNRCFTDQAGEWRAAFDLQELPAIVMVTDEGYVLRRHAGFLPGDGPLLTAALERLVQSGKLVGRSARDFHLPEVGSSRLKSLADVAQRDYTILFSLRADCTECVEELKTLQLYRDRNPEQVSLVVIFHDADADAPADAVAAHPAIHPDHAVRDPGLTYADRYAVSGLPFLLVIDPEGKITLARKGVVRGDEEPFEREMNRVVSRQAAREKKTGSFAELRRIRAEGLEFLSRGQFGMAAMFLERALELNPDLYTLQPLLAEAYSGEGKRREAALAYSRYLAAEPKAFDRDEIEERIGLLTAAP